MGNALRKDEQRLAFAGDGAPVVQVPAVETPPWGPFSGIRTGSLGAGSVGVGVGLGTTTGLGIVCPEYRWVPSRVDEAEITRSPP